MLNVRQFFCITLFLVFAFPVVSSANESRDVLISIAEAKAIFDTEEIDNVVFVDSRSQRDFIKNHILGAASIPTDETFSRKERSDLVASVHEIQKLMAESGITKDSRVVVYGGMNFLNTARLFWVMETFGIRQVQMLNGRFSDWESADFPLEHGVSARKPATFVPSLQEDKLAIMREVFKAMDDDAVELIDARPPPEFKGKQSQTDVYGHIPTAINIPWANHIKSDFSGFKPIAQIAELYKGTELSNAYIVYCNTGKESAVNYVALRLLGAKVKAYDGSWTEWSAHEGLPVTNLAKH